MDFVVRDLGFFFLPLDQVSLILIWDLLGLNELFNELTLLV